MREPEDIVVENGRTLLRCVNCDDYFPSGPVLPNKNPLFCSEYCREESAFVRHARRMGNTTFPNKSSVLESIKIWLKIVIRFRNSQNSEVKKSDVVPVVHTLLDRIGSDVPLKECDDEIKWLKMHSRIAHKRFRFLSPFDEEETLKVVADLKEKGATNYMIAKHLNEKGLPTITGAGTWIGTTVAMLLKKQNRES